VGRASDVYALGGILYYLLTARAPFQAETLEHTIALVLNSEPVSPRLLNPSIARDLETITLKCLEKDPARRYQTAQDLADELGRVLRHEPIRARPINKPEKLWRWCRRKPGLAGAVAFATLAVLAGFGTTTWQWRRAEKQRVAILHDLYVAKMNLVQTAWEANNVGRVRQLLEETAATPERGFEWYYWQRQTHLQVETLPGHGESILAVAYSPDGRWIVTGSADQTARVWGTATSKVLHTLRGHSGPIRSVAFSSDSQYIVTGSFDQTAKIWESESGKELQTFEGHEGYILSVAFSGDGRQVVTGSRDQKVKVWDVSKGVELFTLNEHTGPVWCVAFSPDSQRIVTASWDGTAKVWDARTGTHLQTFKLHHGPVLSAAFSPDGERIVSGGFDQTARIWEAATGKELGVLKGHGAPVVSVAFSKNGLNIATAGEDQTARVWDAMSCVEVVAPKKHGSPISSVAFSPDGQRIVTGGGSLIYSPDGIRQIHAGPGDRTAKVWEILNNKGLTSNGNTDQLMAVAFSPDSRWIVTGSMDRTAKLWDVATRKVLQIFKGHRDGIRSVAFSPDGQRIATASWDQTAIVWDVNSGQPLLTIDHKALLMSVVFSPDGRRIATAGQDGAAKVWDAVTGAERLTLKESDAQIWSVVFSPDGRRILISNHREKFMTSRFGMRLTAENCWVTKGTVPGLCLRPSRRWPTDYHGKSRWNCQGVGRCYWRLALQPREAQRPDPVCELFSGRPKDSDREPGPNSQAMGRGERNRTAHAKRSQWMDYFCCILAERRANSHERYRHRQRVGSSFRGAG
jgi:WD40 repeat protein